MALHGFDYPDAKRNEDHAGRLEIFDIITPCAMSQADIDIAISYDREAALVGILFDYAKRYACDKTADSEGSKGRCARIPSRVGFPRPSHGQAV